MRKILSCEFNPDTACVELCKRIVKLSATGVELSIP